MKATTELESIAKSGGGLILNAARYMTTDLQEIVRSSKTTIVLQKAATKTTIDLQAITRSSEGRVILDLSE